MASLFLSYSSVDRPAVARVRDRLEAEGFAALYLDFDPDRGTPPGRSWEREIYAQLRKTDGVIFFASTASVDSRWCFAELSLARSLGKPVFPLRLEGGARLALLDDVQWVDLAEGDGAFIRLLTGLRRAGLDPTESFAWDPLRPPYPGLEPFAPEDAAVFFGRERESDRLLELLQPTLQRSRGRFVAIVGPSGSGKSSLLHAGLLPRLQRLEERWLLVPAVVPGARPTEALAHSLARCLAAHDGERPFSEVRASLRHGAPALVELAQELARLSGGRPSVLVLVDQAEELLTRTGITEQRAFLDLLHGALQDDSPLWAVATLRSEFLSARPERAGLAEVVDDSLVVEPLSRARLPEVIKRPAQRAGLDFAPGLPERMVEETTGGDALPLLAYTLRELYQRAGRDGTVTVADYEAVGGVIGALQRRADRVLDDLIRRDRGQLVLPTLMQLAAVEREGEPTRRRLAQSELDAEQQAVVEAFVDARLLTSSTSPGGETTCEVAHEALLRQWPPLREAIEAARSSLQMRSELERLATDWDQAEREESYLLRGGRLHAFDDWAGRHTGELTPGQREFLDASRRLASRELDAARRSTRRLRVLAVGLAALLLVALVAGGLALQSNRRAQQQTRLAQQQTRLALSGQLGAQADSLAQGRPDTAVLVGLQSLSLARDEPTPEVPRGLVTGLAHLTHASQLLTGHKDQVHEVAFGRDGGLLASASWDGTIRFWDARSGRRRGEALRASQGPLTSIAFSPHGTLLAAASRDRTIRLWEARARRPLLEPLKGHTKDVNAIAFSPGGNLLASASDDGTARLWDLRSAQPHGKRLRAHRGPVQDLEFSPDGKLLATAGIDNTVHLWDVASRQPHGKPLRSHRDDVWGLSFSPDGKLLATTSADKKVRLWRLPSRRPRGQPLTGHTDDVWDAAFSPDSKLLATASADRTVRLWEVRSGRPYDQPLRGHTNTVQDVKFSPDGKLLASAGWDNTVRVWNVAQTVSISRPLTGHTREVYAVESSPNGKLLASASMDRTVRLWDLPSGRPHGQPLTGHSSEVNGLAFSHNGKLLASAAGDGTVRLWKVPSGQRDGRPLQTHQGVVYGVAFSPDGRLLATAGEDKTARLWTAASRRPYGRPFKGHAELVYQVTFSPDGKLLATASADQTARLWDVDSGEQHSRPLRHKAQVRGVDFNRRGDLLASASADGTARLWAVRSPRRYGRQLSGHTDAVWDAAFSPEGDLLATASADGTARLWDVRTQQAHGYPLSGHEGVLYSLTFSRDGRLVATAGGDETVRLWKPSFEAWVSYGCKLVNRNLSRSEWNDLAPDLPYERTCPNAAAGSGAPADAPAAEY
jgi:WD40 repeat protein